MHRNRPIHRLEVLVTMASIIGKAASIDRRMLFELQQIANIHVASRGIGYLLNHGVLTHNGVLAKIVVALLAVVVVVDGNEKIGPRFVRHQVSDIPAVIRIVGDR